MTRLFTVLLPAKDIPEETLVVFGGEICTLFHGPTRLLRPSSKEDLLLEDRTYRLWAQLTLTELSELEGQ